VGTASTRGAGEQREHEPGAAILRRDDLVQVVILAYGTGLTTTPGQP
jgi:hypothetical protein